MRGLWHTLFRGVFPLLVVASCGGASSSRRESKTNAKTATSTPSAAPSAVVGNDTARADRASASPLPLQPEISSVRGAERTPTPPADVPVVDEPIYFPGARTRPKGSAVEASLDDEIIATWNRGGLSSEPTMGPKGRPTHTAPRVKVDVIDVRGDASEADMQRVARLKSYWPFRICYEQGLRRMQKLHGTIKLRLTIGPSGRPSGVQQLAAELGDPAVVSCVTQSAMSLGLPAPSSGASQVTLDISLWPGDEPVTVKSALRGTKASPAETAALVDQLRTHLAEVRTCYAAGLARHAGLWGRLALALRMTSGVVDEANEIESRFPDGDVTNCVRQAFLHAEVPITDRELTIVYPLRLGHAPDARDARR
jgi:hypothetical protein